MILVVSSPSFDVYIVSESDGDGLVGRGVDGLYLAKYGLRVRDPGGLIDTDGGVVEGRGGLYGVYGFRLGLVDTGVVRVACIAVGMTNVRTTVVVILLNIRVVVVTVVVTSSLDADLLSTSTVLVASPAVPRIVRDPIIVDTKVRGGIVVVNSEVMVNGLSRV